MIKEVFFDLVNLCIFTTIVFCTSWIIFYFLWLSAVWSVILGLLTLFLGIFAIIALASGDHYAD